MTGEELDIPEHLYPMRQSLLDTGFTYGNAGAYDQPLRPCNQDLVKSAEAQGKIRKRFQE
jgi:hypothetical protein